MPQPSRLRLVAPAALLVALALAACGKDATAPANQLSRAEAEALAQSMAGVAGGFAGSMSFSNMGVMSASAPTPISFTYEGKLPCPAGGTMSPKVKVTGSLDLATRAAVVDMDGTEVSDACAHTVDGKTIKVSGTLQFAAHTAMAGAQPTGTQTFQQKGSFDWTRSDGTKGTCTVDFSASVDFTARTRTVTGNFCGQSLNSTGPLK